MNTKCHYRILRSMARIMSVVILCLLQGAFAQECADVSGTWHGEETATVTFNIDGEIETVEGGGSWDITIEQNGCDISFYTQEVTIEDQTISLLREGTVTQDRITFSGPMGGVIPGASYSENLITGDGVIEGDTMTVTTTGEMIGTIDGVSFIVTHEGTAVFARSGPVGFAPSVEKDGSDVLWADTFGTGSNQFTIEFAPISGDASSANGTYIGDDRPEGFREPGYDYRIGVYEITNDQWNKFQAELHPVTVTGSPSSAYDLNPYWTGTNVPTNNVSWYEAAQFVNWLNTSTGHQAAYKFTGTPGTAGYSLDVWQPGEVGYDTSNPYRNRNAFYFLPTEDEWVKAAYWNGTNLQTWATPGDTVPVAGVDANYNVLGEPWNVGSGSAEINGTFDMMGNVWEWMESPYFTGDYLPASYRGIRGSSYGDTSDFGLWSSARWSADDPPSEEELVIGFRVASVLSSGTGEPNDPTLVVHWPFDETEGGWAFDSTGENHGMVMGAPVWRPEEGRVDGALELTGTTFIMASFVLNPADGPFSVLAWVKGGQPGQGIITQQGGVDWLYVDAAEGNLATELSRSLCSQTVITDGDWHRVGITWDGSACLLYVDDVLEAESTEDGLASSAGGIVIGCRRTMAGTFFTGLIDDVRIYSRAVRP